jgi:hypothetical protein
LHLPIRIASRIVQQNKNVIRVAAAMPSKPMLINGIGFIATPLEPNRSRGMELLTGVGLLTQLGDFTSFFIGTAVLIFSVRAKRRVNGCGV